MDFFERLANNNMTKAHYAREECSFASTFSSSFSAFFFLQQKNSFLTSQRTFEALLKFVRWTSKR